MRKHLRRTSASFRVAQHNISITTVRFDLGFGDIVLEGRSAYFRLCTPFARGLSSLDYRLNLRRRSWRGTILHVV